MDNVPQNWTFSNNMRGGPKRGGFRGGNRWNGPGGRGGGGHFGGGFRQNYSKNQSHQRFKREAPEKRLSEKEIGITEYMSDHPGFNGIIKSRYSDFQVSEISLQGEVAKLTNMKPPEPPVDDTVDEDEDLLLSKYNLEILPMETWDSINKLAVSQQPTDEKVEIDVSGMTKEQRTKIHDAVKKAFGAAIIGSTVNIEEKKLVQFEKYRKGVRVDNRVKWVWPGEYVHFVVHKENCDTMDAVVRLADALSYQLKPSMVGYAGTKDRRAKTSQWFSLRKVDPRQVSAAANRLRDVWAGDYRFSDTHLKLGMLRGNKFRIALRNVTASDEVVAAAVDNLRTRGFLNYYGLQRFGTRLDTPTYVIGLRLLQGNFKEAIAGILEQRAGPLGPALAEYARAGPAAALRARAPPAALETRLLRALAAAPNDLHGALNKLARNTRLLYLHSYQSYVWNRAATERVRRLGLRPAPGDLVPLTHVDEVMEELDSEAEDTEDGQDEEEGSEPSEKKEEAKKNEEEKKETNPKVPVKVLTQEDVDSGKYTLFDIVIPLPGFNVEYPPNLRDFMLDMLKKDGLNLEMRHKIRSYSMSGAYRRLAARAEGVAGELVRYDDPYGDLIQSDYDDLVGRHNLAINDNGKYKALILTMSLPPSCYATMALRELLKVDTSGDFQALQNNYHKKPENEEVKVENTEEEKAEADESAKESQGEKRKVESEELKSEEVEAKRTKQNDEQ